MRRNWVIYVPPLVISGLISLLISALYAHETRKRLKWYVDGKVAAK